MGKIQYRDISPLLQQLRNFLLGRKHTSAARFQDLVATRSPPPPCLPDGPCHGIAANYYYNRDVRREIKPAAVVASNKLAIASGCEMGSTADNRQRLPTPGQVYLWD